MRYWFLLLLLLGAGPGMQLALRAQQPAMPVPATRLALQLATIENLPAAPLKEARRTLAQARQRFARGLPAGELLFVTATLLDNAANRVPRLVQVQSWQDGRIMGRLVGADVPEGNEQDEFEETQVIDWMILRPDGSEEGNYVGKFLDLEERIGSLSGPR